MTKDEIELYIKLLTKDPYSYHSDKTINELLIKLLKDKLGELYDD